MKYTLSIIALLTALSATAQTVTFDTLYQTQIGATFYEIQRFDYADGSYSESSRRIGDTASLLSYHQNQFDRTSRAFQGLAQQLQQADRVFGRMIALDATLNSAYGIAPILANQLPIDTQFVQGSWEYVDELGAVTALTFGRTAAGKLRVTPLGGTARVVHLFGAAMRIPNFPTTGRTVNFYRMSPNLWVDADRRQFLRVVVASK